MSAISSPCIKACLLDPASKLCEGCGRSLAEIARWGSMSEAERLAIMAGLAERLARRSA
ncbi:DUF1289 domain-containing protein [Bosea sp. 124]|mgnify:CR=1 FL=1|uniref:DUF1289 domain-containing protein n=1 Tax=Bosea sp. 124 TaxID=2135642 RepID=UPI000D3544C6|nr:DUF1289 domain-containing protein [Bosea sp. 124]PTM38668.1 hypothetical protein C8D03_0141 [Bosea sp. 124]